MKMKRAVSLTLSLAIIAFILITASCSAKANNNSTAQDSIGKSEFFPATTTYAYDTGSIGRAPSDYISSENANKYPETTAASGGVAVPSDRKIINTVSMTLQTLEFESAVSKIEGLVSSLGGYVENSYVSGPDASNAKKIIERYANFTLRIPAGELDGFVDRVSEGVNVLSKNENASDITDSYYDIQARLDSLLVQEERLISMLKDASELKYMLEVERELADVRYQIESYYSQIKRYDSGVAMSTVSIDLREVVKYEEIIEEPKNFAERLANTIWESWKNFLEGGEDFLFGLIMALPALIIIAVIAIVVSVIVISSIKRKKRKERKTAEKEENNKIEKDKK